MRPAQLHCASPPFPRTASAPVARSPRLRARRTPRMPPCPHMHAHWPPGCPGPVLRVLCPRREPADRQRALLHDAAVVPEPCCAAQSPPDAARPAHLHMPPRHKRLGVAAARTGPQRGTAARLPDESQHDSRAMMGRRRAARRALRRAPVPVDVPRQLPHPPSRPVAPRVLRHVRAGILPFGRPGVRLPALYRVQHGRGWPGIRVRGQRRPVGDGAEHASEQPTELRLGRAGYLPEYHGRGRDYGASDGGGARTAA
ncbi:hypothetical protein LXA43DRAFT_122359 [Ganoderma leucocontextum]|nr:hypothetical protein LXA43DRAFT_122359 [Ganoderma leucocontextum]